MTLAFLLPDESSVAVIQTLAVTHRLAFDPASGVDGLRRGADRLLISSGDDRDHRAGDVKAAAGFVRVVAPGFGIAHQ